MSKPLTTEAKFLLASRQGSASLRDAGYSAADLRDAGYSAADLRALGYSAADLRDAGYSAEIDEMLKDVPLLDKPYTRLLNDIREKRRTHKQSTFGDLDHYEPDDNVCGMPMCTAGHFVQMAGKAGFKLKRTYDWTGAYQLLHMKAHPDTPPQSTASIPQDWAMAYIETMAVKEAAQQ
ncbi:MAG: hypothetical protein JNK21_10840 [Rhodospirillaceae bacterium]|nr:hypothetical protein [Rhodospirillaceae bacterium]